MTFSTLSMLYPSLASENPIEVLRLIRTPNVGPVTFFQLIRRFGTTGEALRALPELSLRGGRKQALIACPEAIAQKEMEATEKFGARMILYGTREYPRLLHAISDPPPLITVIGHPHLWQKNDAIALVGARNASANGCQFAGHLAKELGQNGLITTSGLARGIDSFVHKGSLVTGTIAVIAGGIDNIYPPENEVLYRQIRESGTIISEQPFGMLPYSGAFPGRNRIIAGMSLGTVVVEASPKSGSLITARFAMENNREVFAVPGAPLDPRSRGCNHLIKQGATMVENAADILQGIAHLRNTRLEENPPMAYMSDLTVVTPDDNELVAIRNVIIEKLGATPVLIDELIEQCQIPAGTVMTILLELELAGRLKRGAGNRASLVRAMAEEVA